MATTDPKRSRSTRQRAAPGESSTKRTKAPRGQAREPQGTPAQTRSTRESRRSASASSPGVRGRAPGRTRDESPSWQNAPRGPETYRAGREWEHEDAPGTTRDYERRAPESWPAGAGEWRGPNERYRGRPEAGDWGDQQQEPAWQRAPYRREEPRSADDGRRERPSREWPEQERGRWTDDERHSETFRRGREPRRDDEWREREMPPRDWRDETYTGERGFEGGPSPWSVGEWSERAGSGRRGGPRRDGDDVRGETARDPREYRGFGPRADEPREWRREEERRGWGREPSGGEWERYGDRREPWPRDRR